MGSFNVEAIRILDMTLEQTPSKVAKIPPKLSPQTAKTPTFKQCFGSKKTHVGVNPKIGVKPPKMDGENNGKPYQDGMIWGENHLFSETPTLQNIGHFVSLHWAARSGLTKDHAIQPQSCSLLNANETIETQRFHPSCFGMSTGIPGRTLLKALVTKN